MKRVITYGTFDLFHYGHQRLLERAKALGDYLIVGVTADDFDKARGKINVQQSLMERLAAVKATGLADEIIVEEYEGQKIDDIKKHNVDIFTVGSDWQGKFDYLSEYCKVVYLDRTEGVSSTEIRSESKLSIGLVGSSKFLDKVVRECGYVNELEIKGVCSYDNISSTLQSLPLVTEKYDLLLDNVDTVYIYSYPGLHYREVKEALERGKHVLCESPFALSIAECEYLMQLAKEKGLILMSAIKTAYSTAYWRLLLLVKSGIIGNVISVDSTCTSLDIDEIENGRTEYDNSWNSIAKWGPTALLPVFQILGTDYKECRITSKLAARQYDTFTKIDFVYCNAVASIKVGRGAKSEGELIISGTKGYIYVPAPWWKTDYFEVRYENPADNRRYFYQLEGEGLRYEFVSFSKAVKNGKSMSNIDITVNKAISGVLEQFNRMENFSQI